MKTIRLKCRCGADFEYIDDADAFAADNKFRYHVAEVANKWLARHQVCIGVHVPAVPAYFGDEVESDK